jgi:hypothetical protein
MSSATFDRPIHVVPDIPTIKARFARFAALRELRGAAYRAYYKAMSLARTVVRWALGQLHRLVEATGGGGFLSWLRGQAVNVVGLIREAGIVPSVVAVLSTPPIAAAAVSAVGFVGRGIVRIAKAAWTGIKSLLGRFGTTGKQITASLSRTGTKVAATVRAMAKHPMVKPIVKAFKATLALVRPVSQGFVTQRLLAALVPVLWLRAMIAFLFMPFLVDSTVVGNVWDWATARPATQAPKSHDTKGTDDSQDDSLIDADGTAIPMPRGKVPHDDTDQADVTEQADDGEHDDEGSLLNRAERRAQQRQDSHDRRTQHQRR